MKMNLATAQQLLDVPNQVHSFLVLLDNTANTKIVQAALNRELAASQAQLETLSWEEQGLFYR